MSKEKQLTEEREKLIDEKLIEAIQIWTLNQKPIEDTVLALPVESLTESSNSIQITNGIATSIMIFINVMIIFKNL